MGKIDPCASTGKRGFGGFEGTLKAFSAFSSGKRGKRYPPRRFLRREKDVAAKSCAAGGRSAVGAARSENHQKSGTSRDFRKENML